MSWIIKILPRRQRATTIGIFNIPHKRRSAQNRLSVTARGCCLMLFGVYFAQLEFELFRRRPRRRAAVQMLHRVKGHQFTIVFDA